MSNGMNIVAHNLQAMFSDRQLGIVTDRKGKSTEKLSSGYRINRAADDAAGLAISEKMRRQIKGLTQGTRNVQDGISMCQIADGALNEVSDMMHRLTELSVQSANGTNDAQDRQAIQQEVNALLEEIDRVSDTTTFNEMKIFGQTAFGGNLTYDDAKERLIKGTYLLASKDIELSNGMILSKDSTNDFIKMLSSAATLTDLRTYAYNGFPEFDRFYTKLPDVVSIVKNNSVGLKCFDPAHVKTQELMNTMIQRLDEGLLDSPMISYDYYDDYHPGVETESNTTEKHVLFGFMNISDGYEQYNKSHYAGATWGQERSAGVTYAGRDAAISFIGAAKSVLASNNIDGSDTDKILKDLSNVGDIHAKDPVDIIDAVTKAYMSLVSTQNTEENCNNVWIQSGVEAGDGICLKFGSMNTGVLRINGINVSTQFGAEDAISRVKSGLGILSGIRSDIGAQQNRLEHTIRHQENTIENTQQAESLIRDTDMASEMMNYSAANVIQEAGQAMLSQANHSNQGVLSLLQ